MSRRGLTLDQMAQQLHDADQRLRERGLDGISGAVADLLSIVQELVSRAADQVPLAMDEEYWPAGKPGPMRLTRSARPSLADMSDAEIDRFFPRGHPPTGRYYYIRRDYELFHPFPDQPGLLSIRRQFGR